MSYGNTNGLIVVSTTILALGMAKTRASRTISNSKNIEKYSKLDRSWKVEKIDIEKYLGKNQFPDGISIFENLRVLSLRSKSASTPPLKIPDGWDQLNKLKFINLRGRFDTGFLERALTISNIERIRLDLLSYTNNNGLGRQIRHQLPHSILKTDKSIYIAIPTLNGYSATHNRRYTIPVSRREYILIHSTPNDELCKMGYNLGILNSIKGNHIGTRFGRRILDPIELIIESSPLDSTTIRRY